MRREGRRLRRDRDKAQKRVSEAEKGVEQVIIYHNLVDWVD